MLKREFIAGIGSSVVWPLAAAAQQPALPTVGFVSSRSGPASEGAVAAFRKGLGETRDVEGQTWSTTGWRANSIGCKHL